MKDIIIGIYKITNKINGKSYVGQSTNIFNRWDKHRWQIKSGDKPLYKAFRKYGIENFTFEILEQCPKEKLDEREVYWTSFYDTYKNGYNLTPGGDCSSKTQRTVSDNDVINIRKRRLKAEPFSSVYKDYQYINEATFKNIWLGKSYMDIYVENFDKNHLDKVMIQTKRMESAKRQGSQMNEELVLSIRTDKKYGMRRKDAYEKYKQYFVSLSGFDSIWYSKRWKEIQP